MDLAGNQTRVAYDNHQLSHNHSAWSFVRWCDLVGVQNKSIQKTAKYRGEVKLHQPNPDVYREELEVLSRNFSTKYLLAIMNSSFARQWLATRRRNKLRIYPEDWKPFPIAVIPLSEQQPLIDLVDHILNEFQTHGHPLPNPAIARVAAWEQEIDTQVYAIYGIEPNAVGSIAAAAPTDLGETDDGDDGDGEA